MTKYYILKNENELLFTLYKFKPNHPFLLTQPFNENYLEYKIISMNDLTDEYPYMNLVEYPDYYTTSDIVITKDKTTMIQASDDFYESTLYLYDILPQLKKLGAKKVLCECVYQLMYFHENFKFDLFTDEEWCEFLKEILDKKVLILSDDI